MGRLKQAIHNEIVFFLQDRSRKTGFAAKTSSETGLRQVRM